MEDVIKNFIFRLIKGYNFLINVFINYDYSSKKNPTIPETIIRQYNKTREKGANKTICYAPSKHMYFGFNGLVRACCINKEDVYGDINKLSIQQIWNSPNRQLLKDKITDFNLADGCKFCNQQLVTGNFKNFEGRIYDSILNKKESNYPTEMTFEISNTCNLECIMCNGDYSSSIRKNRDLLSPLPDMYGPGFLSSIKDFIPHLQVARFLGGEPFLIPQYIEIIEYIIQVNKKCKIYIQTNGSILNNRVKSIIAHENIHLSISIDSLEKERYEYIRKNASFDRLMEHLEFFKNRSKNYGQDININFCVMVHNWKEVPAMLSFCNEHNFTLTLIALHEPKHLNIRIFSKNQLQEIHDYYSLPEHLSLLKQNTLNAQKYTDLIRYVKYFIDQSESAIQKINAFQQMDTQELLGLIDAAFRNEIFKLEDIELVKQLLHKNIANLDERDKKLFLSKFLFDVEMKYNDIVQTYNDGKFWSAEFEEYFRTININIHKETRYNLLQV